MDSETAFLGRLRGLNYTLRDDIRDRAALEANFRQKFEALNRVTLTDAEFARLLDEIVTPDVFAASKTLRGINAFTRDDGTPLNYSLVNLKDWCKNDYEAVHQLRINTDNSHHRYDVLLLINGVPVAQVELKTLGVNPRRAMEQIVEYKNDPGNGYTKTLLCFLQRFIVSNRDRICYFANNNSRHFAFNADERFLPVYEFADEANRKVTHLDDFAAAFLPKCTLGRTLSRYMVLLAGEQKLMIMRPYQVYAVRHLVRCIDDDNGNGFIWHTTGSGKTLTSFKASTLLKENDHLHKCVFVVDRKDLDQLDFEFVLFASAVIDYDYIMGLIAKFSAKEPGKARMTREQLIGLISADAKFMDERDDIRRERHPRGLHPFQKGQKPPRTQNPRRPGRLCGQHPRPHDLRRRTAQRPLRPPRPRLESPQPGRTRPHGRPASPPHPTRRGARHLRTFRLRIMSPYSQCLTAFDQFVDLNKLVDHSTEPFSWHQENDRFAKSNSVEFDGIKSIATFHFRP